VSCNDDVSAASKVLAVKQPSLVHAGGLQLVPDVEADLDAVKPNAHTSKIDRGCVRQHPVPAERASDAILDTKEDTVAVPTAVRPHLRSAGPSQAAELSDIADDTLSVSADHVGMTKQGQTVMTNEHEVSTDSELRNCQPPPFKRHKKLVKRSDASDSGPVLLEQPRSSVDDGIVIQSPRQWTGVEAGVLADDEVKGQATYMPVVHYMLTECLASISYNRV
jgi:hypothetical protein